MGLTGFYRKFVEGYSVKSRPLREILKKGVKFEWTDECERSFQERKDALIAHPVLAFPEFNSPFNLYTDGSYQAVGAVLTQVQKGSERVIAYTGRVLNIHETRYPVTELEALAMIHAVTKFDIYLRHSSFTVYTDHINLD